MASNATGLGIVNLNGGNGANLRQLNIIKVDVVRARVDDGEQQDRVGQLSVHPEVFVQGNESEFRTDPSHDSSTDRKKNEHAVNTQDKTCTSRHPDGVLECVQAC